VALFVSSTTRHLSHNVLKCLMIMQCCVIIQIVKYFMIIHGFIRAGFFIGLDDVVIR
jgi:hypothetical protein